MASVFVEVILPIILVASTGVVAARRFGVPAAPLSTITMYLFAPALVFNSLSTADFDRSTILQLTVVTVVLFAALWGVSAAWSSVANHDPPMRAAFALSTLMPNAVNVGFPVAVFAFGDEGLEVAVIYLVAMIFLNYSAGFVIASMSSGTIRQALGAPFRYPIIYAAVAGVLINIAGITTPETIATALGTLSSATIPVMLVLLGIQLSGGLDRERTVDLVGSGAFRLLLAPALMFLMTELVGLDGVIQDTLVVLSATPTAVGAVLISTEFSARPQFVTLAVASSTFASIGTLTTLITLTR
jgi:malate permease and related proteins